MNRIPPIIHRPPAMPHQGIKPQDRKAAPSSFANLLKEEISRDQGVKFSKHAAQRLETRSIHLTDDEVKALNAAVEKADQKGMKDSLILMKEWAFIVNVPSKVVVTAMDGQNAEERIFTNIDGAVIL